MPETEQRILKKMLDRLFASLVNGPSLNCRPHSSRQRIDLTQLAKLKDVAPGRDAAAFAPSSTIPSATRKTCTARFASNSTR